MSTNKTDHYGLHAWEPGDDFLLSEINENFAALEEAVRMVFGSYTGTYNGADGDTYTQIIELGFQPKAVLVENRTGEGAIYIAGPKLGGGAVDTPGLSITESGIRVSSYGAKINNQNTVYYYLVLR